MSGTQVSSFGDPNVLLQTLSGAQTANVAAQLQRTQENQLLQPYRLQEAQQVVGGTEMEYLARASAGLLDRYPDEAARAAAYPGVIADLQRYNFAKNAPSVYPGEARLRQIAAMGTPSKELLETGDVRAAVDAYRLGLRGGAPGGGGGGAGLAAQPLTGDIEHDRPIIVARESGGKIDALNYVAMADPSAYERGATASGKYQFVNSTWREGMQLAGIDPSKYPTARSAPEAVQDQVFNAVYAKYGTAPWDASRWGQNWVPTPTGRFILARPVPGSGGTQTATAGQPGTPPAASPASPAIQQGGPPPAPPGGSGGVWRGDTMGSAVLGVAPNPPVPAVVRAAPVPAGNVRADAGAIAAGMQQAQATPVPGVLAAGPAAGPSPAPPAAAPEAGWGTGGATAYSDSPTVAQNQLAPKPPTPQPATPTPAAAQPPAAPTVAMPAPPPPVNPRSGLNADQEATINGQLAMVRTRDQLARVEQQAQTYRDHNETVARQYQADVRQAQNDAETRLQHALENRRADEKAAREAADEARKVELAGRQYQGSGIEAQDANVLLGGDDGSARYAGAYARQAAPRVNVDGSTVIPNMTAYDKPTYRGGKGQDTGAGGPDYGTVKTTPPTQMNATQSLAAGFADRMRNSLPIISDTSSAAMNRWQVLLGKAPVVGNSLVSPDFQMHMQAERDFINAVLRRESGAAISEPEFVNARAQYIPQPGDSKEVLTQKQKNRETVLANLVRDAGPAYKPAEAPSHPPPPPGFKVVD